MSFNIVLSELQTCTQISFCIIEEIENLEYVNEIVISWLIKVNHVLGKFSYIFDVIYNEYYSGFYDDETISTICIFSRYINNYSIIIGHYIGITYEDTHILDRSEAFKEARNNFIEYFIKLYNLEEELIFNEDYNELIDLLTSIINECKSNTILRNLSGMLDDNEDIQQLNIEDDILEFNQNNDFFMNIYDSFNISFLDFYKIDKTVLVAPAA